MSDSIQEGSPLRVESLRVSRQLGLISAYVLASFGPILTTLILERTLPTATFANYATFVATVSFTSALWLWGSDGFVVRDFLRGDRALAQLRQEAYQRLMLLILGTSFFLLVVLSWTRASDVLIHGLCLISSGIAMAILNGRIALRRAQGLVYYALGHGLLTGFVLPSVIIASSYVFVPSAPVLGHAVGYSLAAAILVVLSSRASPLESTKLRAIRLMASLKAIFQNGLKTVPHTLALIGILTFDRVVPGLTASSGLVATVALAGLVGAIGQAGLAAITSSRLSYAYSSDVPERRMAGTVYIALACVAIGVLLVEPVSHLLGWSSQTANVARIYGLAPLCAIPYAAMSSLIFVEKKEKLLTILTPTLFFLCGLGYAVAGYRDSASLVPMVQAAGYSCLSIVTLAALGRWGRNRKALVQVGSAWILTIVLLVLAIATLHSS